MPLLMCDLDDTLVQRAPLFRACAEGMLAEQRRPDLCEWLIEADHGGHADRDRFWAASSPASARWKAPFALRSTTGFGAAIG